MDTINEEVIPDIKKCKDIGSLREAVSNQFQKRGMPVDISWHVAAIDASNSDRKFSNWLFQAMAQFKALKNRNKFKLLKGENK
jgi:hypothetical protein